ncbi:DUF7125 family protein [Halosimplex amylolyticum]|uniref:DUF7125 family protein n=1 Tax=Halosimplex amylolyticum TaxID=3396616 RepID=UPI003F55CA62
MIAIAGAKGGSGKTTTTLGLAAAFARSGVETLAVDADRQLPDLHVRAGVEREPTVAALDRETSWHSLAQEFPGTSGAHVLPGQKPTENVELDAALEWLNAGATEVLLDCPSGAGPDVVEAIALADGVVVVTTDSDQSLDAAATTIDIARRLDVPVAGAVFTHCSAVPEAFHARFEIPVLAVVPESESPLASDEARTEYERAAEELASLTATGPADRGPADSAATARELDDWVTPGGEDDSTAEPSADAEGLGDSSASPEAGTGPDRTGADERGDADTDGIQSGANDAQAGTGGAQAGTDGGSPRARHDGAASNGEAAPPDTVSGGRQAPPTGLTALDVDLSGLPPGSVAVVEAPPASQSEQLLYGLTATRGTLYVSTERTERTIRASLDAAPVTVGSPTVRYLTEDRLAETERLVGELPDGSNVVVDTMAPLERADRDDYREFLNGLKGRMLDTDSIAVLHCLSRPSVPENRATTEHVADAVISVEPTDDGADRITVPKFRAGGATPESVDSALVDDERTDEANRRRADAARPGGRPENTR